MQWLRKTAGVSDEQVLGIGDVAQFMSPADIGLVHAPKADRVVIEQFKSDHGSASVLVPCADATHTNQPCLCAFLRYRESAHEHFYCDCCERIPIGTMWSCKQCSDVVYTLCDACHELYEHQCGEMEQIDKPMSLADSLSYADECREVAPKRAPCNVLRSDPTEQDKGDSSGEDGEDAGSSSSQCSQEESSQEVENESDQASGSQWCTVQ